MSAENEQAQARIDVLMGLSGFLLLVLIGQRFIKMSLGIEIATTVLLALAVLATIAQATKRAGLLDK